jgi:hypothetical protein
LRGSRQTPAASCGGIGAGRHVALLEARERRPLLLFLLPGWQRRMTPLRSRWVNWAVFLELQFRTLRCATRLVQDKAREARPPWRAEQPVERSPPGSSCISVVRTRRPASPSGAPSLSIRSSCEGSTSPQNAPMSMWIILRFVHRRMWYLNRIASTRAATIATSSPLKEEWKSCQKRRPPFAIRGPKRICGNSKSIRKQGHPWRRSRRR